MSASGRQRLAGRVALVTGAARGLGDELCRVFVEDGAQVVGADLNEPDAPVEGVHYVRADAGSEAGAHAMVAAAIECHGRLDSLILNAGIQRSSPIATMDPAVWESALRVNLTGPALSMKVAWPHLTERPGGRIVVTASTASSLAEVGNAAYVASKHGVAGLVRVAALEGASAGLTANAVAPAWMRTPLGQSAIEEFALSDEVLPRVLRRQGGRIIDPRHVALVASFLASDDAAGMTGAIVPVDHGFSVEGEFYVDAI